MFLMLLTMNHIHIHNHPVTYWSTLEVCISNALRETVALSWGPSRRRMGLEDASSALPLHRC